MDNVRMETHFVSVMNWPLETVAELRDEKDNRPLPPPNSKTKTDGEGGNSSKESGNGDESSSDQRSKIPCRHRICNNPSCGCWPPAVCPNYKSKNGCTFGNKCFFRHVGAEQKPSKESKKGGAKGSLASVKESTRLCIPRFLSEKVFST